MAMQSPTSKKIQMLRLTQGCELATDVYKHQTHPRYMGGHVVVLRVLGNVVVAIWVMREQPAKKISLLVCGCLTIDTFVHVMNAWGTVPNFPPIDAPLQ